MPDRSREVAYLMLFGVYLRHRNWTTTCLGKVDKLLDHDIDQRTFSLIVEYRCSNSRGIVWTTGVKATLTEFYQKLAGTFNSSLILFH